MYAQESALRVDADGLVKKLSLDLIAAKVICFNDLFCWRDLVIVMLPGR